MDVERPTELLAGSGGQRSACRASTPAGQPLAGSSDAVQPRKSTHWTAGFAVRPGIRLCCRASDGRQHVRHTTATAKTPLPPSYCRHRCQTAARRLCHRGRSARPRRASSAIDAGINRSLHNPWAGVPRCPRVAAVTLGCANLGQPSRSFRGVSESHLPAVRTPTAQQMSKVIHDPSLHQGCFIR